MPVVHQQVNLRCLWLGSFMASAEDRHLFTVSVHRQVKGSMGKLQKAFWKRWQLREGVAGVVKKFVGRLNSLRYAGNCRHFHLLEAKGCNGEGNGTPLQYSCLENPMDGGAW